jgi:hypothetical protein
VNLLDHNMPRDQVNQLRRWKVHVQQIGFEVGRPEWDDQQEVLRLLHRRKGIAFFTRDLGFFRRRLCHPNYCLVVLTVPVMETATYIRRLLRHPVFRTKAGRQGKVLKVSSDKIIFWSRPQRRLTRLGW